MTVYMFDPVSCPNCEAGPGRQMPIYEGHDDGMPYATGEFKCEVCRTLYWPNCIHGTDEDSYLHWAEDSEGREYRINCGCPCRRCREF